MKERACFLKKRSKKLSVPVGFSAGGAETRQAFRLEFRGAWIYGWLDVYPEHAVQVAKWGNSLAIRLPAALVQALQLKAGDHVDLIAEDRRTLAISRKLTREEAVARLAAHRAQLPVDYKFDREEANAR